MAGEMEYRYTLRLTSGGEKFFGPGVARLLRLVEKEGSLRQAAMSMGMAYSKAWRIMSHAEKVLGFALVDSRTGGRDGGGATLTAEGVAFLARYERFEDAMAEAARQAFAQVFGGTAPAGGEKAP